MEKEVGSYQGAPSKRLSDAAAARIFRYPRLPFAAVRALASQPVPSLMGERAAKAARFYFCSFHALKTQI